jgi:hypothetical protein
MILNIKIVEENVLQGDISPVRKELEMLTENAAMIKKYQNNIGITFMNLTLFDVVRKLKTEPYRNWFKRVDRDIPGIPLFLSESNNSLLIYLMGNIAFDEKDGGIIFDKIEASRFFKEKQAQIRNLCLSNNINPESALNRISDILSGRKEESRKKEESDDKPASQNEAVSKNGETEENNSDTTIENSETNKPKKSPVKDLLDKYGAVAYMTNDRAVKLTIALSDLPGQLSFSGNYLVKDPEFPQSFFSSVLSTEKGDLEIRSLIIPDMKDVENSINQKNGIQIQVVYRIEDGSYQKIFESDKIFPVKTVLSLKNELKNISPVKNETVEKAEVEHISENDGEKNGDIDRILEENELLKEKVLKLEKLIEVYEDEIHRKRSMKGFFKKFFG